MSRIHVWIHTCIHAWIRDYRNKYASYSYVNYYPSCQLPSYTRRIMQCIACFLVGTFEYESHSYRRSKYRSLNQLYIVFTLYIHCFVIKHIIIDSLVLKLRRSRIIRNTQDHKMLPIFYEDDLLHTTRCFQHRLSWSERGAVRASTVWPIFK